MGRKELSSSNSKHLLVPYEVATPTMFTVYTTRYSEFTDKISV